MLGRRPQAIQADLAHQFEDVVLGALAALDPHMDHASGRNKLDKIGAGFLHRPLEILADFRVRLGKHRRGTAPQRAIRNQICQNLQQGIIGSGRAKQGRVLGHHGNAVIGQ